jgi:hypothetical protein
MMSVVGYRYRHRPGPEDMVMYGLRAEAVKEA